MAESRVDRPSERGGPTPQPDDRKHLTRVGSLLVVVLGSLLLGAVLRQEPGEQNGQDRRAEETRAVIESEIAIEDSTSLPTTAPTPAPTTTKPLPTPDEKIAPPSTGGALSDLARRAGIDFRRLPRDEAWMLQLAAICDAANVERLVQQVSERELHVLPVEIKDRACFRICWGPFDSRSKALAAADGLPAPIRSLSAAPQPRLAASLIP